jgi:hypothetical protein
MLLNSSCDAAHLQLSCQLHPFLWRSERDRAMGGGSVRRKRHAAMLIAKWRLAAKERNKSMEKIIQRDSRAVGGGESKSLRRKIRNRQENNFPLFQLTP